MQLKYIFAALLFVATTLYVLLIANSFGHVNSRSSTRPTRWPPTPESVRAVHAAAAPPSDPCLSGRIDLDGNTSPVSAWYFINVAGATAKEARVRRNLDLCGVPVQKVFRVPAVTQVRAVDSALGLWWRGSKSSRFSIDGIPVLLEDGLPLREREVDVLLSHLRAARMAYDAGHETVIVLEDDASFEYVRWWHRGWDVGLRDVIEELNNDHEKSGWDICQLSMAMTNRVTVIRQVAHLLPRLMAGKKSARRDPVNHRHVWGASAYLLSRTGMKKLLDLFWPGGAVSGMSLTRDFTMTKAAAEAAVTDSLTSNYTFDFRRPSLPGHGYGTAYALSDVLLYSVPMHAFFSTRPLFSYETDASEIHFEHLAPQEQSKQLVSRLLYLEDRDNTDPHWWSFRDSAAEKGSCGCDEFVPA